MSEPKMALLIFIPFLSHDLIGFPVRQKRLKREEEWTNKNSSLLYYIVLFKFLFFKEDRIAWKTENMPPKFEMSKLEFFLNEAASFDPTGLL